MNAFQFTRLATRPRPPRYRLALLGEPVDVKSTSATMRSWRDLWSHALAMVACLAVTNLPADCAADLIGHWTFEGGSTADSTGNFGALQLYGAATIVNGELIVSRSGTFQVPQGWAKTDGSYSGATISSKTLVSWISLTSLSDFTDFGSAMTLDAVTTDTFDGIVFGELQQDSWMNGSNFHLRTEPFTPGFQETSIGPLIQMAYTYSVFGSDVQITGYRDGVQIGQYDVVGNAATWGTNDAEIIFGARHANGNDPVGALNARIAEARLYDRTLTPSEIAALALVGVPEIDPAGLGSVLALVTGALGLLERRRSRR